jgi:hypothetical protein
MVTVTVLDAFAGGEPGAAEPVATGGVTAPNPAQ